MNNLPFWFDDLECFYYIPEHKIISFEDAVQKYGIMSNTIMQCKAWWNTNIPMDNFLPILIPCDTYDAGLNICLEHFTERIKQRVEGVMCPAPPELHIKLGLVIILKETSQVYGVLINLPDSPNEVRYMDVTTNNISQSWVVGEVIKRDPDMLYWDMLEGKYV